MRERIQQAFRTDPQSLNSYSYAGDNPITKSDPQGTCFDPVSAVVCALAVYSVAQVSIDAYDYYQTHDRYADVFTPANRKACNSFFRRGLLL